MSDCSDEPKLNFYSKYNRVRDRQSISSLYMLISDDTNEYLKRLEQITLTLNVSRDEEDDPDDNSPIRTFSPERKLLDSQKSKKVEKVIAENQEEIHFREMEEKLKTLERLERNFHQQLQKSEKDLQKKKQLKQMQKREQQKYRIQLINVIEQTSEQSQNSQPKSQSHSQKIVRTQKVVPKDIDSLRQDKRSKPNVPEQQPKENEPRYDFDDYYHEVQQVKIKGEDSSDFDMGQTKRKLRQMMEMQKREKFVESVDQEEGKTSSIVIDRLKIISKPEDEDKSRENKNYYEIELNHSQSENVIRNHRTSELEIHTTEPEVLSPQPIDQYQPIVLKQQPHGLFGSNFMEQQHTNPNQIDSTEPMGQPEQDSKVVEQIDLREQFADKVQSIRHDSEHNLKTVNSQPIDIPVSMFHSQANPRKAFQNQQEVQSIAESMEFHPLEQRPIGYKETTSKQILPTEYEDNDRKTKQLADKKSSFKKLMAANRANLIPRLAISTILNQHINQALGDYRASPILPAPLPAMSLHESIISSEGSTVKPSKLNFKQILRQNKNSSNHEKPLVQKDARKIQQNKQLLLNFFDQN